MSKEEEITMVLSADEKQTVITLEAYCENGITDEEYVDALESFVNDLKQQNKKAFENMTEVEGSLH